MSIATTILQQLGGNRFIAMTGASNIGCLNDKLSMKLPKNNNGANYMTIELTPLDVYHLKFLKSSPAGFRAGEWRRKNRGGLRNGRRLCRGFTENIHQSHRHGHAPLNQEQPLQED